GGWEQEAWLGASGWDFRECAYRCDSQAVSHTCHMPYQRPNRRLKLLSYPGRTPPAHEVRGLATKEKKLTKRSVSSASLLAFHDSLTRKRIHSGHTRPYY